MQVPNLTYGIREVKAFVGHSFASDDEDLVSRITDFLAKFGFQCNSGRRAEVASVRDKVRRRISEAEVFVGIFTRRSDKVHHTSAWVIEEKTIAIAEEKKVLLFVEKGVTEIGGMHGDLEYIEFERDNLGDALVRAIDYVMSISSVALQTTFVPPNKININFKIGSLDQAIIDLRRQKERQPQNHLVRLELAKALRTMGQTDEYRRELERAIIDFPGRAEICHDLAHAYEHTHDIDNALRRFQEALDLNSSNPENYKCFAKLLSKKAVTTSDPAARQRLLEKSRRLLTQGKSFADDKKRQELDRELFVVEEKLKEFETSVTVQGGNIPR